MADFHFHVRQPLVTLPRASNAAVARRRGASPADDIGRGISDTDNSFTPLKLSPRLYFGMALALYPCEATK